MGFTAIEWRKRINSRDESVIEFFHGMGIHRRYGKFSTKLAGLSDELQEEIMARMLMEFDEVRKLDEKGNPV